MMTDLIRANFPAELIALDQWLLWKLTLREGEEKPTKVPYNPTTCTKAETNNPNTWGTFAQACAALAKHQYDGLGFVFSTEDPYTGIDLDACVTDGRIDPLRWEYIRQLDSYNEFSPSGTGVHRGRAQTLELMEFLPQRSVSF